MDCVSQRIIDIVRGWQPRAVNPTYGACMCVLLPSTMRDPAATAWLMCTCQADMRVAYLPCPVSELCQRAAFHCGFPHFRGAAVCCSCAFSASLMPLHVGHAGLSKAHFGTVLPVLDMITLHGMGCRGGHRASLLKQNLLLITFDCKSIINCMVRALRHLYVFCGT